jgi:hypothetical protein
LLRRGLLEDAIRRIAADDAAKGDFDEGQRFDESATCALGTSFIAGCRC